MSKRNDDASGVNDPHMVSGYRGGEGPFGDGSGREGKGMPTGLLVTRSARSDIPKWPCHNGLPLDYEHIYGPNGSNECVY